MLDPPLPPPPAQPEPLVADRPDFTEATDTIPPGRVQIEAGVTLAADASSRTWSFPEVLARVGVSERLEIRFTPPSAGAGADPTLAGWSDAAIGTKVRLCVGEQWAWSLIAQLSLPANEDDFGGSEPIPEAKVLWAVDLSDRLSLAGNINAAAPPSDAGGRFFEPGASVSLGCAITDRLGAFVECFGIWPIGADAGSENYVNGGFTYQFTPDFQVDIRAGVGLGADSDDSFAGLGFALRF